MREMILTIVVISVCSAVSLAQSNTEIFGGYSVMRTSYKANLPEPSEPIIVAFPGEQTLHGFNASVTHYLKGGFGITGDFSWNTGKESAPNPLGGTIDTKIQVYNFLGGAQYKFHRTGRFSPFVRALAGAANTRVTLDVTGLSSDSASTTDFALALGGGLDVRVNKRFAIRAFQVDYNPIFLSNGNPLGFNTVADNWRFSFGVVFR